MTALSQEEFKGLFIRAIDDALALAQQACSDVLPQQIKLYVGAFGLDGQEVGIDEAIQLVYHSGSFPVLIDIAVSGITENSTILWIRPSSRPYVTDVEKTYDGVAGLGPFKPLGIMLPYAIYLRPRPWTRKDLEDAAKLRFPTA
ncbi:MAG TPA: hypothetical protein VMV29_19985 [Ktedonobacterales bacterium]|nr:hypothetical protein [Ktedonobacterales bacterium]